MSNEESICKIKEDRTTKQVSWIFFNSEIWLIQLAAVQQTVFSVDYLTNQLPLGGRQVSDLFSAGSF